MNYRRSLRAFPLLQLFAVVLLLTACGLSPQGGERASTIVVPQTDHRDYRYVELGNGLRAVIVSDPSAKKAAASLDVNVGSSADPEQRQGLAHFLEHMLFLGTQKYPDAGEYQEFITAHGGSNNAFTAFEHTNYFFDIDAAYLPDALDRFSQFFVAPLFTAQYVDREKNAVDSEFRANYKNEYRRAADVLREVVNQEHPFHKFSVGSLDTLSDRDGSAIRDDLLKFYDQYYSANIMTLAVVGREPADELEKLVREKFSAISDQKRSPLQFDTPFFDKDRLPAQLTVVPEKEVRQLSLTFPIPDVLPYQREKPTNYIAYLLGHEGDGSLLSYLKTQGWADTLSAGEGISYRGGASFDITITLTREGVKHQNDVIASVFQAVNRVSQQGVEQWRYDEQAALSDLAFRYQDAQQPMNDAMLMSGALQYYAPQDVIRGRYLMAHFDATLIKRYLSFLAPDNMLVTLVAPGVTADKASAFYKTPYAIQPIAAQQVEQWRAQTANAAITLPAPNPFVPQTMTIASVATPESAVPQLLSDTGGLHLWHLQDDAFALPKTSSFFSVRSPQAQSDVRQSALLEWYVQVLRDDLNELAYPAQLAGLDYRIDAHARGFSVRISGYDDKQAVLLKSIIDSLHKRSFDSQRVVARKNDLLRRWRNADAEPPYQVLMRRIRQLLYMPSYDEAALADAIEPLDVHALEQFIAQFWQATDIDALVVGNADATTARNFGAQLSQALITQVASLPPVSVVKLSTQETQWQDANLGHADSALLWYLQGRDDSPHEQALSALSSQMIETQFYQSLRTEQQFGYVVYAGYMPILTVPGIAFVVQSPRHNPQEIEKAVMLFWQQFADSAVKQEPAVFERNRAALVHQLLEPPKNLTEKAEDFWMSIALGDDHFTRRKDVAAAVGLIGAPEWQQYMREQLAPASRRDLLLQTGSQQDSHQALKKGSQKPPRLGKKTHRVDDVDGFKQQAHRFAYP